MLIWWTLRNDVFDKTSYNEKRIRFTILFVISGGANADTERQYLQYIDTIATHSDPKAGTVRIYVVE